MKALPTGLFEVVPQAEEWCKAHTCHICRAVSSDGAPSPSRLVHDGIVYRKVSDWLCDGCGPKVHADYREARARRLEHIWASQVLGYVCRLAEIPEAYRVDQERRQLVLPW